LDNIWDPFESFSSGSPYRPNGTRFSIVWTIPAICSGGSDGGKLSRVLIGPGDTTLIFSSCELFSLPDQSLRDFEFSIFGIGRSLVIFDAQSRGFLDERLAPMNVGTPCAFLTGA
jgi:hypothetical protein